MGSISRRFITVEELEEQRRQRIAAGKPAEDDTPYDPRSLFEQLQAQKDEKQRIWDEQHAFKNQVRGLNEEETQFLDECALHQMEKEKEADTELRQLMCATETKILDTLTVPRVSAKLPGQRTQGRKTVSAQKASLLGAIKRRRTVPDEDAAAKSKIFREDRTVPEDAAAKSELPHEGRTVPKDAASKSEVPHEDRTVPDEDAAAKSKIFREERTVPEDAASKSEVPREDRTGPPLDSVLISADSRPSGVDHQNLKPVCGLLLDYSDSESEGGSTASE